MQNEIRKMIPEGCRTINLGIQHKRKPGDGMPKDMFERKPRPKKGF